LASEFERTSKEVGGRHIVITSWFDETRQVWRASAPQYASLSGVEQEADLDYPSRNEALTHLCRVLARDLPVAAPTQYPRATRPR
jgi:regulator of sigma D